MKLFKYNDYVYYTDYEEERDRPRLGYIQGQNYSIAIDAGHSDSQVAEFYHLLKKNKLPLPSLTILTHWHWDHTFGMHAVKGLTIASKKTNDHLKDFIAKQTPQSNAAFLELDKSIALEYADDKQIIVVPTNIEYENSLTLDLGNEIINIFEAPSPHSDDCTLIYLNKAKVIFIGDGTSGVFPTWEVDKTKAFEMAKFLVPLNIDLSIGGHWENQSKEEMIAALVEED